MFLLSEYAYLTDDYILFYRMNHMIVKYPELEGTQSDPQCLGLEASKPKCLGLEVPVKAYIITALW